MLLNYMVIISWLKLLYLSYNVNPFVICILAFGSCRFERLISVYLEYYSLNAHVTWSNNEEEMYQFAWIKNIGLCVFSAS